MTKHNRHGFAIPIFVATSLIAFSSLSAHEYWIEPTRYVVPAGQQIQADLKVGSNLKGQPLSYIPQFTQGYELFDSRGGHELSGTAGDRPALVFTPEQPGLNIITYQTTRNLVTFQEWEKFIHYVELQGMRGVAERHLERGLPQTDFAETYSRYVKSLVLVGDDPTGQDKATGMKIELVALQNPYTLAAGDELSVQLFYLGRPLQDHQVSIFTQDQQRETQLQISRIRTDENGQVHFQLQEGKMYMLNAIKITEVDGQGKVAWESFWTSLTFELAE